MYIDNSLALAAYAGISFTPEKRAQQIQSEVTAHLDSVKETLSKHAEVGGTQDQLEEVFGWYQTGYLKRYRAWLGSMSRCMSTMIAGPSNFPVRQQEKRRRVEHARCDDLVNFQSWGISKATRMLRPDLRPVMTGDADALERLEQKLAGLERYQACAKLINAWYRKFKKKPECLIDAPLTEEQKEYIRTWVKPHYQWDPQPHPSYSLTNNNANIRRVKQRIEQISRNRAQEDVTIESDNGIRLEDCPTDNRIRVFFPGKPDESTRSDMKSNGFRWTPSLGCWQAYRNHHSMQLAKKLAKVA